MICEACVPSTVVIRDSTEDRVTRESRPIRLQLHSPVRLSNRQYPSCSFHSSERGDYYHFLSATTSSNCLSISQLIDCPTAPYFSTSFHTPLCYACYPKRRVRVRLSLKSTNCLYKKNPHTCCCTKLLLICVVAMRLCPSQRVSMWLQVVSFCSYSGESCHSERRIV